MFYSIYTECNGNVDLHPGSIAAILQGNGSNTKQNLTGTDDGIDLVSPNGANDLLDYFVFQDKNHAIQYMANFPIAHLKKFNDIKKARSFVLLGPDFMPSEQSVDFFEPSHGELESLRKCIKGGELDNVKSMISNNPKILLSFGGIPTNLYPDFNYNALHICAQYNQPKIAELILHTIGSRQFVSLYIERMNVTSYVELSQNFLEVFLNTPDDIQGETPLHIAVKFGHVEVVKVLTLYSACKSKTDIDGKLPMDIICKFAKDSTMDLIRDIRNLLLKCYHLPILSVNNVMPSQDTGDDSNNEGKGNVTPDKAVPSYKHRKQFPTWSFESLLAPFEDKGTLKKARRSLFSVKLEDASSIERSDQVSAMSDPDDFERLKLSSIRLKHPKNVFVNHTMTSQMISKPEISFPVQLDLSTDKNNTFNNSSSSLAVNVSLCPNPWHCIESSLQENINLIAGFIIEKLKNMSSSNSLLLIEMKTLEAVIWKHQKDEHFSKVPFEKMHSRIGSLLASAMEKSQDIIDIKANIENNISDVFTQCSGIQGGFTKCICGHLLKKLSEPPKSCLNSLKNETLSAMVTWMEEESCYCKWQNNILNDPEISVESFPKIENIRKLLSDGITECFKKVIILDDKLMKNNIQVDDEKQTVGEDDNREKPGDMKNTFVPVKENGEILSKTLCTNPEADELFKVMTTLPISIDVSIKSTPTPPQDSKSDKPFAASTPKKDPGTSEGIFTTPASKKPGLYSKYREKPQSDDDSLL